MVASIVQVMAYQTKWGGIFTEFFQHFPYVARIQISVRCEDFDLIFSRLHTLHLLIRSSSLDLSSLRCFLFTRLARGTLSLIFTLIRLVTHRQYHWFWLLVSAFEEASSTRVRINTVSRKQATTKVEASIYDSYAIALDQFV